MRTRFDFVSNSSSCSFIVNDIKSFNKQLKLLSSTKDGKGIDTYWMSGLNIRFEFKSSEENKKLFKDFIDMYSCLDDDLTYGSGDFYKFLSIDPKDYGKMEHLEVYAYDDCGCDEIQKLALLYFAMRAKGVNVDSSESEHEFELFPDVPVQIANAAIKMIKQEINK